MYPRILLVDDIKMFLEIEKNLLEPLAVQIATAGSGEEALRLVEQFGPDLVVLDSSMPSMDGVTCCKALKGNKRHGQIPVIMTVSTCSDNADLCRAAGCDALLTKPLDPRMFLDAVTSFIPDVERRDRRADLLAPVVIKCGGRTLTGAVLNLSRSGAFVEPDEELKVGAVIEVSLTLPSLNRPPLQLPAKVIRLCSPDANGMHAGVGIAFLSGSGAFQRVSETSDLAAFLSSVTGQS